MHNRIALFRNDRNVSRRELAEAVLGLPELLLEAARGPNSDAFDRAIDNQVSRLRRKIEADPKAPEIIKTVWGGGYALSAEVTRL